jgi:hypothetical protein
MYGVQLHAPAGLPLEKTLNEQEAGWVPTADPDDLKTRKPLMALQRFEPQTVQLVA